jgi:glutaminyl-tRNA synthetase
VKATLHWVSAPHALDAESRLYDVLFKRDRPEAVDEGDDWLSGFNPDSLVTAAGCKLEPSLAVAKPGDRFQFERKGYFACDPDSRPGRLVFNRTATLRDTWAKAQAGE